MAAAIPFALKAGSMIGGSLLGKKLSGPSKPQEQAMQGAQQGSQALTQAGQPLLSQGMGFARQGMGNVGAAADYYRNILGSRTAARGALAPETATALNYYRGAEGKAKRTLRGGSRDVALAELDREKVGNLALMLPQARALAAGGLLDAGGLGLQGGTALTGQGTNALANAAYANAQLFGNATTLRNQEQEGGRSWGNLLYDALDLIPTGGKPKLETTGVSRFPTTIAEAGKNLPSVGQSNPYYTTTTAAPYAYR